MGLEIQRERFSSEEFARFAAQLEEELRTLEALLADPAFGRGPRSIGAELEVHLVDEALRPAPLGEAIRDALNDPQVQLELNRYNLELNTRPFLLDALALRAMSDALSDGVAKFEAAARARQARVALIGTLPTLRPSDLGPHAMTDAPRYRALSRGLRTLRGDGFRVHISGRETLSFACDDVTLEGANASLQLHLRVAPDEIADVFNAAQLATAPALAAACNSPFLLGRWLWEETRVPLFRQAVDERVVGAGLERPSRVSFGHGWVRRGALELFEESVALHRPLLPVLPEKGASEGGAPPLDALRLHHGTIWPWNRVIYDPAGQGHVRIELRALPSGPTVADMVANAALLLGLTLGMAPLASHLAAGLPFAYVSQNFYRAARDGLQARLAWPGRGGRSPAEVEARSLLLELLPVAERGLVSAGIDPLDARAQLDIIRARLRAGVTGARFQGDALERHGGRGRDQAMHDAFACYLECAATGEPVAAWPRAPIGRRRRPPGREDRRAAP